MQYLNGHNNLKLFELLEVFNLFLLTLCICLCLKGDTSIRYLELADKDPYLVESKYVGFIFSLIFVFAVM